MYTPPSYFFCYSTLREFLHGSSRALCFFFFFSSRRRHTRSTRDWSSDVCSSDLAHRAATGVVRGPRGRAASGGAGGPGGRVRPAHAGGAPVKLTLLITATLLCAGDRKSVV